MTDRSAPRGPGGRGTRGGRRTPPAGEATAARSRLRAEVRGAVQGVGFRPFVHRLAREAGLGGWVVNDTRGVVVEVEGPRRELERFLDRLSSEPPPTASLESVEARWLRPIGLRGFSIRDSDRQGRATVQMLPDVATCPDCLHEVRDPAQRRHRYPFTNCAHCGPRLSIILSLPYDRARTTMSRFTMCGSCRAEYENPLDRRFHAQPIACPRCGPRLRLWRGDGSKLAEGEEALTGALEAIRGGRILAVKGLGGFHLVVDARDGEAVRRLRAKKPRRDKPFALMVEDLEHVRRLCEVDDREEGLLTSPEAPIVLLRRRRDAAVHANVAPDNPYLGVMLPYTPLHHLIVGALGFPVVATSGNLSDEPICTDEREALSRLAGIPDLFLVHDRPIARHVDDSVAWVVEGRARILRRARGFAPRPIPLDDDPPTLLAVGADLKNAVALSVGGRVFLSQHIGDMETPESLSAFERVVRDFTGLYDAAPVAVAHDMHPDYVTTRWARAAVEGEAAVEGLRGLRRIEVQHHHAHLASCLAENSLRGPALGVTWDGTGYGPDGTVWGGEFLLGDARAFRREASLRGFRLPGGEAAVREPRRTALAALWELEGEAALDRDDIESVRSFPPSDRALLARMLGTGLRSPRTTSAGRLFDAAAALIGLRQRNAFEGQAAMALEFVADPAETSAYPVEVESVEAGGDEGGPGGAEQRPRLVIDWRPAFAALLDDLGRGVPPSRMAGRFHNALARAIVRIARDVGEPTVALTGGCFQNRLLVKRTCRGLRRAGFRTILHRRVPPNDGGIGLGQIVVAAARLRSSRPDAGDASRATGRAAGGRTPGGRDPTPGGR